MPVYNPALDTLTAITWDIGGSLPPTVAPDPTIFAASMGAGPFDHFRVFRATSPSFATASDVSGSLVSATFVDTGAGATLTDYWWWIVGYGDIGETAAGRTPAAFGRATPLQIIGPVAYTDVNASTPFTLQHFDIMQGAVGELQTYGTITATSFNTGVFPNPPQVFPSATLDGNWTPPPGTGTISVYTVPGWSTGNMPGPPPVTNHQGVGRFVTPLVTTGPADIPVGTAWETTCLASDFANGAFGSYELQLFWVDLASGGSNPNHVPLPLGGAIASAQTAALNMPVPTPLPCSPCCSAVVFHPSLSPAGVVTAGSLIPGPAPTPSSKFIALENGLGVITLESGAGKILLET